MWLSAVVRKKLVRGMVRGGPWRRRQSFPGGKPCREELGREKGKLKCGGAGVGEKVLGELLGEGREKAGGLKGI